MHCFGDQKKNQNDDDTLSLSSDSTVDSAELLERRAIEIRNELRVSELAEIAHVAERAAAAGHETFAGQASTFIGDGSIEEESVITLQPVPIKRNISYTEGLTGRALVRPLLRRSQTGGKKRKIPVMALRHIDDLIPPMNCLHQHLRAHLYMNGVDTENSLKKKCAETNSFENCNETEQRMGSNVSLETSFIAKVQQWVTQPTTSPNIMFEKEEFGCQKNHESDYINCDPDIAFETGYTLSEHITSVAVAQGKWKPTPVEAPEGLISHTEKIPLPNFMTPRRRPSLASLWKKFGNSPQETSVGTAVTSSISSEILETDTKQHSQNSLHRKNQESDIIPVALFDSDEEEDIADDEQTVECALGSRYYPKPFEIAMHNERESYSPHLHRKRRVNVEAYSPKTMPNLFITPVRLKGIRHANYQRNESFGRSSLAWGYSRADSFLLDSGTPVMTNDSLRRESFVNEKTLSESSTKLNNNIIGAGFGGSTEINFLKPRRQNIDAITDIIGGDNISTIQTAGEATHDASKPKISSKGAPINFSYKLYQPILQCNSKESYKKCQYTPTKRLNELDNKMFEMTSRVAAAGEESSIQSSGWAEISHFVQRSQSSVTTSLPQYCECMPLDTPIIGDTKSKNKLKCRTDIAEHLEVKPVAFRRVISCPSLAEACSDNNISSLSLGLRGKRSLLNVLEQLSPSSERSLQYCVGANAKENHDYLNNYLYFSKPYTERVNKTVCERSTIKPFCADPCEMKSSCGKSLPMSCDALCAVSDTACVLFKRSETDGIDLIHLETTNDYAGFEARSQESWFDAASAQFDGAMERIVGAARQNPNSRWGETFQAPTLTIKTPQHGHRKTNTRSIAETNLGIIDTSDSSTSILQQEKKMYEDAGLNENNDSFVSVYGMSRNNFRTLSKDRRLALWEDNQQPKSIQGSSSEDCVPTRKTSRRHRSTLSTSDIGEIWMEQAKLFEQGENK
mmetsp:Transcript_17364/g.19336  ORF Transcript_17364/g.19336 Transcript_17364/m.19336 type:complete len:967 (+) Transcript_17364:669-3569(+)